MMKNNGRSMRLLLGLVLLLGTGIYTFAQQSEDNVKTIQRGVLNGIAVSLPQPRYPESARIARALGAVRVRFLVDVNGNVISAKAMSGNALLKRPAERAAWRATFKPMKLGSELVQMKGIIMYTFVPTSDGVELPTSFKTVGEFLRFHLQKGDELQESDRGDGDGLEDWAGAIWGRDSETENGRTHSYNIVQVFILFRQRDGNYKEAVRTERVAFGGMGCCFFDSIKIANPGIFIETSVKDVRSLETLTAQFKMHNDDWRMVGIKAKIEDHAENFVSETEIDILKGSVIQKEIKAKGRQVVRRRQKKFGTFLLSNYEFNDLSSFIDS